MAQTVGIFSRSGEDDYSWLRDGLQEHCTVLSVIITNSNQSAVRQSIYQCQFAILYHTKNRGRINLTDVTDSLYDDEIRQLSDYLGADQVTAVIDDLNDSSAQTKESILNSQPTLRAMTRGIFLFTTREKQNRRILREKLQRIIDLIPRPINEHPEQIYYQPDQPDINRATQQASVSRQETAEDRRPARRDENIPRSTIKLIKLVVSALSAIILLEAYFSPDVRNLILAGLWTVEFLGTFYKRPLEFLWSNRRIRFMLLWTITLVSSYNTYCRFSIGNAGLSVLWLVAIISLPHSHRFQAGYKQLAFKALGYVLVFYSFGEGWQMRNATNTMAASEERYSAAALGGQSREMEPAWREVHDLIIQIVFCSPVTLIVVGFPHQGNRHDAME